MSAPIRWTDTTVVEGADRIRMDQNKPGHKRML